MKVGLKKALNTSSGAPTPPNTPEWNSGGLPCSDCWRRRMENQGRPKRGCPCLTKLWPPPPAVTSDSPKRSYIASKANCCRIADCGSRIADSMAYPLLSIRNPKSEAEECFHQAVA